MLSRKVKIIILSLFVALFFYATILACVDSQAAEANTTSLTKTPKLTTVSGDVNGDGKLTSDDAVYLLLHKQFSKEYPVADKFDVDVNKDGTFNSNDALYLLMNIEYPKDYPLYTYIEIYERIYIGNDVDMSNACFKASVKEMQEALIALGYQGTYGLTIKTDGNYTYDLMRVISYYQIVHGIGEPDGKANPSGATWNAIDSELAALKAGTYKKPSDYSIQNLTWKVDNSDLNVKRTVRELQYKLKALGYSGCLGITIYEDGEWDYDMVRLLAYYQLVNDINDPDGIASAGGSTWSKIDSQYKSYYYGSYKGFTKYSRVDIDPNMDTSTVNAKRTIRELATYLNLLGYKATNGDSLAMDGAYTADKISALRYFQLLIGVGPDGCAKQGGTTWSLLDEQLKALYDGTYKKSSFTRKNIWYGIDSSNVNVAKTIREVKYKLTALGYADACGIKLDVLGKYDYSLLRVMSYFQIVNGITDPDGWASASGTIQKIRNLYDTKMLGGYAKFTPYERVDLPKDATGTSINVKRTIKELEWALATLGYKYADNSAIKQDGVFTSKLAAVVKEYQQLNGDSSPDGACAAGGWTWAKIDAQIKDYHNGTYSKPKIITVDFSKYSKGAIANCGHDENGDYVNGEAGDQKGDEWKICNWYDRPWNYVLRYTGARAAEVRALIAKYAAVGALNDSIGYDQKERTTFWDQLVRCGYDPAKINIACETDCSAGVLAVIKAVGYTLNIQALKNVSEYGWTGNMKSILTTAGFTVCSNTEYLTKSSYLLSGDVLLNVEHHTTICIKDGDKASDQSGFGGNADTKPEHTWTVTINTNSESLNVRSGPGTEYDIVDHASKGSTHTASKVGYDSNNEKWTYLYDMEGWVKSEYLK